MKLLLVVAVALVDADDRVLIAQRPEGKSLAGLWEFPGGKVEAGERPEETLIRELKEELGVDVKEACLAPLTFAGSRIDQKLAAACRKRCRFTSNPKALLVRLRTALYIAMADIGPRLLDAQRAVCLSAPGIWHRNRSRYKSMRWHNSLEIG